MEWCPLTASIAPSHRLTVLDAGLIGSSTGALIVVLRVLSSHPESAAATTAHLLIATGLTVLVTVSHEARTGILATTVVTLATFSYGVTMPYASRVRILQPGGDTTWSLGIGIVVFSAAMVWLILCRKVPRNVDVPLG